MNDSVEQLLQKITFVERDIELHKNILATIPATRQEDMEKVIKDIARLTHRAEELKRAVAERDPQVHAHITRLEKATEKFQELAAGKTFEQIITLDHHHECAVELVDGTRIECLIKARDAAGDWTILTLDGETREYRGADVCEG